MPIYEYQCGACGHEFDKLQKITDTALTECPQCAKPELRKLVSSAGFHLKGTGWYVTDFRDQGKKSPAAKTDAAKTPAATTESKVEAATDVTKTPENVSSKNQEPSSS